MKVLVAVKPAENETPAWAKPTDLFWATDGELVCFPRFYTPGSNGAHTMIGMGTRMPCSVIRVEDHVLPRHMFLQKYVDSLERAGLPDEFARDKAAELLQIAGQYETGTLLERRAGNFFKRTLDRTA